MRTRQRAHSHPIARKLLRQRLGSVHARLLPLHQQTRRSGISATAATTANIDTTWYTRKEVPVVYVHQRAFADGAGRPR